MAFTDAIKTAPAAMSLAIFAIGSNDVVAMSIAASTPVFSISAISTNVIEMQSAISSSFVTFTISAATITTNATAKWIRMFRCVRTTWMIPSAALLNESKTVGGRRTFIGKPSGAAATLLGREQQAMQGRRESPIAGFYRGDRGRGSAPRDRGREAWRAVPGGSPKQLLLARLHLVSVVVAEQVQQPVRQRPAPFLAHHLRAEHDVAECTRHSFGDVLAAVDRERQHVGRLVDPEVLALQPAHLVLADERDPELPFFDPFGPEHTPCQFNGAGLVDLGTASVLHVDGDHRFRSSV